MLVPMRRELLDAAPQIGGRIERPRKIVRWVMIPNHRSRATRNLSGRQPIIAPQDHLSAADQPMWKTARTRNRFQVSPLFHGRSDQVAVGPSSFLPCTKDSLWTGQE